jgi:hypothetical protein
MGDPGQGLCRCLRIPVVATRALTQGQGTGHGGRPPTPAPRAQALEEFHDPLPPHVGLSRPFRGAWRARGADPSRAGPCGRLLPASEPAPGPHLHGVSPGNRPALGLRRAGFPGGCPGSRLECAGCSPMSVPRVSSPALPGKRSGALASSPLLGKQPPLGRGDSRENGEERTGEDRARIDGRVAFPGIPGSSGAEREAHMPKAWPSPAHGFQRC